MTADLIQTLGPIGALLFAVLLVWRMLPAWSSQAIKNAREEARNYRDDLKACEEARDAEREKWRKRLEECQREQRVWQVRCERLESVLSRNGWVEDGS